MDRVEILRTTTLNGRCDGDVNRGDAGMWIFSRFFSWLWKCACGEREAVIRLEPRPHAARGAVVK